MIFLSSHNFFPADQKSATDGPNESEFKGKKQAQLSVK